MIDYLKPYEHSLDLSFLSNLKLERSMWLRRPSDIKYQELLDSLPSGNFSCVFKDGKIIIDGDHKDQAIELAKKLLPWRKGPFSFFGEEIDAEWRSDFKWERIKEFLPRLENKTILDVGCNNGYFMFRMAQNNPRLVLGIDPVVHYYSQFHFLNHFAGFNNLKFEMWGIEHVNKMKSIFDVILSMGIIYHHRNPIAQLIDMREALKPGGTLILETIGIPGDEPFALFPEERYAKMRNVWFVPTLSCFKNWAHKARFIDIEVISDTPLTIKEQRLTKWCPSPHQSLENFLDQNDPTKTFEGYPAPRRFALKAKKRS